MLPIAFSTPWVIDTDELGFSTKILVVRRTKFVVMVLVGEQSEASCVRYDLN